MPDPHADPAVEARLATWRTSMRPYVEDGPERLDELEEHLRLAIDERIDHGATPVDAADAAIRQLGEPSAIVAEFRKLPPPRWLPARLAWMAWWVLVGVMLVMVVTSLRMKGDPHLANAVLAAHIATVTAGFLAVAVAGILGGVLAIARLTRGFQPRHARAYRRAHRQLLGVALVVVAVGFVLGLVWAQSAWNHGLLSVATDPKSMGTIGVLAWLLIDRYVEPRFQGRAELTALFALVGSLNLSTAWLGVPLIVQVQQSGYGLGLQIALVLAILVGLHVLLGALCFVPVRPRQPEARS